MKKQKHTDSSQKDTTFFELLSWLYQRSKRRRRYMTDTVRKSKRSQIRAALLFLVLFAAFLIPAMTHALLQKDAMQTETPLPHVTALAQNPRLSPSSLTCEVSLRIGPEEPKQLFSDAGTVGELLAETGCTVGEDDLVLPDPDTVLLPGMEVSVIFVTYEESREVVSLPYETLYVDCQTIPRGTTSRISYGVEGVAEQLQRRRYENGALAETIVLESTTTTEPVDEQFYRGVGGYVSGVDGTFSYSYYIDVTATYYGGYEEERLTYTGTVAREGVIAVDPDVIPLKSKVYVKGDYGDYGVCSADDIGGGIKGNHIDIFMDDDVETLLEYGFRKMRVYFLD